MIFKYYISKAVDPYYNLAIEQLLFKYCGSNTAVLYLWQNDNTIVIGKHQHAESECKVAEFTAQGGKIARRRSGGGAVFHDLGNQNFSILSKDENLTENDYTDIIIGTLKNIGIPSEFNGRNDITVRGKKVNGNAFYDDRNIICRHGTFLVNTDIEKMVRYLTPGREKLTRNAVKSISARVANLTEFCPEIIVENVREAMIRFTEAVLLKIDFTKNDILLLADKYSDTSYIYGGVLL